MSLMKLAGRLRGHDWTAALIELAIVVVGILIALQVSNWNQDRRDRARADGYYRRINSELVADRATMTYTLAFWRRVAEYGSAAMAHGETGQRVQGSDWKTVLAYYQASQLLPFELENTTFTEMRETGDLALIADVGLRKRLSDYYRLTGAGIRGNILRHDPVYRMQIRGLTPWRVQQYIWSRCFQQLGGVQQSLVDCPSPLTDEEAAAVLGGFAAAQPSLLQNLRYWMSTLTVSVIVIDAASREVEGLATEMETARRQ